MELDAARDAVVVGKAGVISGDGSKVLVYVVGVDESLLMARHVVGSVVGEDMG